MANAKKCDRCGVLYEIKEIGAGAELARSLAEGFIRGGIAPITNRDLCQNCEKSFKEWWFRRTDNEQRED